MQPVFTAGIIKQQGSRGELPTIVLEAGGGGSSASWTLVQECLARRTLVVSYDRAGLGQNTEWAEDVGAAGVASRLASLLVQAEIPSPYLLVGHSLGGLFVQYYAATYPGETAGLVLVDPTSSIDIVSSDALAKSGLLDQNPLSTATRELAATAATQLMVAAHPVAPEVPILVVSAGAPWLGDGAFPTAPDELRRAQVSLIQQHRDTASRSAFGRHVLLPHANHGSVIGNPEHATELAEHILDFAKASACRLREP
jgi:pimeloyl-ACP methyl ester carboxylesterase